eukprot:2886116-Pyramimonas_sp.AAC.1
MDDDAASAHGRPEHVVDVLGKAAEDLHGIFTDELGVGLAADETFVLSLRIGRGLGTLAGTAGARA